MAALRKALDAAQEALMRLYEKGSSDLADHIEHWKWQRREQCLFYAARKKGFTRISGQVVPACQISEQKAKEAITMQLLLQNLQQTDFGDGVWTMSDTSWERYTADPSNYIKTGPFVVEVVFDGDNSNVMWYTGWREIYIFCQDGQWIKRPVQCCSKGLYFCNELGERVYYVDMADEAKKYGQSNQWDIKFQSQIFSSAPVTSSTGKAASSPLCASRDTATVSSKHSLDRRPATETDSPATKRYKHRGPRSFGGGSDWIPANNISKRLPQPPTPTHCVSSGLQSTEAPGKETENAPAALHLPSSTFDDPDPSISVKEPHEGPGCPLLLLKGEGNQLKCLRRRLKLKYSSLIATISTTWQWSGQLGSDRIGRPRMLLFFSDTGKRSIFMDVVQLPKGIEVQQLNLS